MKIFEMNGVLYMLTEISPPEMTWEELMKTIQEARNDFE